MEKDQPPPTQYGSLDQTKLDDLARSKGRLNAHITFHLKTGNMSVLWYIEEPNTMPQWITPLGSQEREAGCMSSDSYL